MPNKDRWTIEKIKSGFERFYKENHRYPTVQEIDSYDYLPTSRTFQRRFNGARGVRKALGLPIVDYTKGEERRQIILSFQKRANESEKAIYHLLVRRFGEPYVHREYLFSDDRRTRTDFYVFCKSGNFSVDVFFPANRHNLIGCLNNKLRTYGTHLMLQYPVIFLQMNPDITEGEVEDIIAARKHKLHASMRVMTQGQFKGFILTKKPLS